MNYLCVSEVPLSDHPFLFYLVVTFESLFLYTNSSRYDHFFSEFPRWSLMRASTVFCKYWVGKEEWETSYAVSTSQVAIRWY